MKIVFMGTPEFAVPSLKSLFEKGYEILAVITQPDKPKGRGEKLCISPIKKYALENKIKVLQPEKIRTEGFFNELAVLKPDLFVTCAFGRILTERILGIPPCGCINVHASLLPKFRGPAPIRWALIRDEMITGITTMLTDIGMDTGDILLSKKVVISDDMMYGQLHDIMAELGAKVLIETIERIENGTITRTRQDNDESTYAPAITKELAHIDWNQTSQDIFNLYRALDTCPGVYSYYMGKRLKVFGLSINSQCIKNKVPGTIIDVSKEGMLVETKNGSIKINELQFDSGKRMTVESYICGHSIAVGEILN
ncbi:MAG: methionyl-tRNA formyltransferase [Clostridia bacterium]